MNLSGDKEFSRKKSSNLQNGLDNSKKFPTKVPLQNSLTFQKDFSAGEIFIQFSDISHVRIVRKAFRIS